MDFACRECGVKCGGRRDLVSHILGEHEIGIEDYAAKHKIEFNLPRCPICGRYCKLSGSGIARKTCGSPECRRALKNRNFEKTCMDRYGCANPNQCEEVREKTKKTNLKKYGAEYVLQTKEYQDRIKKTIKARYGVEHPLQNPELMEKMRRTCVDRRGVDHPLKDPEVRRRIKQTNLEKYGSESTLANPDVREKIRRTNLNKYGVGNPFQAEEVKEKIANTNIERYGKSNVAQVPEVQDKMRETMLGKYGVDNIFKSDAFKENQRRKMLEEHGVEYYTQTDEMKSKSRNTNLERRGVEYPSQSPEVHRKIMARRRNKNGGYDSGTEKKLAEMLKNRNVNFLPHYSINGHEFDFALFDSANVLKCLVDVDGEYYHGLRSDPDGRHVQGTKDCERFGKVPVGVNFVVVDSMKVSEENIAEIMKAVGMDYEEFISGIVSSLPREFPYPTYDEERMRRDWEHLCGYECVPGQRFGQSIIRNFHKSIWSAHVGNKPSPVEAWSDPDLLEKCVRNRFIYKSVLSSQNIAEGFNVCKLAPKVSVFNPSLARRVLSTYAVGLKTVLDPFSGFSGRMLGACSLGMKYTGFDGDREHVLESNQIIEFLGLDATVECKDVLENSGSADVLFTCPPYGLKEKWSDRGVDWSCEKWIDVCLERFKCGRYVLVVDDPGKYAEHVVEEIFNDSHFSSASEYVLVIA